MPYAYGATIKHEYTDSLLYLWLTFKHPMNQNNEPALSHWSLKCDDVSIDIVDSDWIDEFTLKLTSDTVASRPSEVTLEYTGTDSGLETTWGKNWEPWGPTLSTDLTATIFQQGMIILWSGSVASIPSGWALCNGSNGTPDLRNKFVVGAGSSYNPDDTGGTTTHTHVSLCLPKTTELPAGTDIGSGADFNKVSTEHTHNITVPSANHLPPYYALCYIMKL